MLSLRRRRSIFKPPCSVIRGWTERGSRTTTEVPPSREEESRGEKHQIRTVFLNEFFPVQEEKTWWPRLTGFQLFMEFKRNYGDQR
ncbi:uncharacterized protein [Chamaea fasciata]|uniref:uncharacterized protein isoform X2 n=1 Tax=Chamaea fasciata TaxID=190680 RepID=UPI00336A52AC